MMSESDSKILILGLHRVGTAPPEAKIRGLFISPQLLSFELSLVRRMGFRFVTLKQAMENPSGKNAVITFDDGYADNLTNALPVLEKFSAPATVFVITGDVGGKNVVWSEAGDDLPADLMDWDALAQLQRKGWEIGSHAHAHIHLARYGEAAQADSIRRSIFEIEKNLGAKPVSFAYPYGSYNEITKQIVNRLGLKYAVTIKPAERDEKFEAMDLLELKRCSLGGRQFHHYLKTLIRTSKAVGKSKILRAIISPAAAAESVSAAPNLIVNPADNDVMP